jgi:hypothetical protein
MGKPLKMAMTFSQVDEFLEWTMSVDIQAGWATFGQIINKTFTIQAFTRAEAKRIQAVLTDIKEEREKK